MVQKEAIRIKPKNNPMGSQPCVNICSGFLSENAMMIMSKNKIRTNGKTNVVTTANFEK
jgi:hypothetical protein